MNFKYVKIEVFIPEEFVKELRTELNKIGALTTDGKYDNCMAVSKVIGSWRPLEGANPFEGKVGEISEEEECKAEFTCRKEIVKDAVDVIRRVHPYEIPVINKIPLVTF